MDRHGRFGAFTESFDLMREELKKARENERNADRSKKELVASLSHDIKTPVASIKATTELMLINPKDEKEKLQLERINEKAEHINALITDMFHATLEELQALNVTPAEIQSTVIPQLIQNADYKGQVKPFIIPSGIIVADPVRLQQVFDNIIGNSYKYAGTDIKIDARFDNQYLIIDISDTGSGVPDDELQLLLNKFYRGKNAGDKSGYGLGLHISRFLLEQMSGELRCENRSGGGFAVKIMLRLA
jgi:signal transduction histidine kinase